MFFVCRFFEIKPKAFSYILLTPLPTRSASRNTIHAGDKAPRNCAPIMWALKLSSINFFGRASGTRSSCAAIHQVPSRFKKSQKSIPVCLLGSPSVSDLSFPHLIAKPLIAGLARIRVAHKTQWYSPARNHLGGCFSHLLSLFQLRFLLQLLVFAFAALLPFCFSARILPAFPLLPAEPSAAY